MCEVIRKSAVAEPQFFLCVHLRVDQDVFMHSDQKRIKADKYWLKENAFFFFFKSSDFLLLAEMMF